MFSGRYPYTPLETGRSQLTGRTSEGRELRCSCQTGKCLLFILEL
jgi:hypothetical protein